MLSAAVPHSIRTALLENPQEFEESLESVLNVHREDSNLYSVLFMLLAHLSIPESEAQDLYVDIRKHQAAQTKAQGRQVDFRVAMMDYLVTVKPHFTFPKVIELKEYEHQHNLAIRDSLTGLFNRRYLDALLTQEVHRSRRHASEFSVLFMDIDDFKQINDEYGHQVGDLVLCSLADVLSGLARTEDTVARYGGEEFVCLLPETSQVGGRIYAQRILQAVRASSHQGLPKFTISVGLASYPEDGETALNLLSCADSRLYSAKAAGKDRLFES